MESFVNALLADKEIADAKERWDMAQTFLGEGGGTRAEVLRRHGASESRPRGVSKDRVRRVCKAAEKEGSGYRLIFERLDGRGDAP